jgi:Bacterial capsule synthesis protein PGA_cap
MNFSFCRRLPPTGRRGVAASTAICLVLCVAVGAQAQVPRNAPDPATFNWRDLTKELANKMTGTYTVAAVGDVLWQEPSGKRVSQAIRQVLQTADTTVGNLEGYLVDTQNWAGQHGYENNWAPKELAQDLAELGFDMVGPGEANGGEPGMRSTIRYLDEVGIKLPGYGPNLSIARQPVFQELPQGRVGMVAAFPIGPVASGPIASNKNGAYGAEEWGMNPLRLTRWNTVTAAQLESLRQIRDSIVERRSEPDVARAIDVPRDRPGRLQLLGSNYVAAEKPGEYRYEMNQSDHLAQVLAVRNAKELADYVIFTMHIHENRYAFQSYSQDNYPPDYVRELARQLVDNGMDMFVGHGNHTMQGIEIYKGRPIFYNLGNFAVHRYGRDNETQPGIAMTSIEEGELGNHWLQQYINLVAYVAQTRYEEGRLREVRIYPVDLGVETSTRPWSRMSIPQTPTPERARQILTDLQKFSTPFGTTITIENNIGVIRVPPDATVPVGGEVRAGFPAGSPGAVPRPQ